MQYLTFWDLILTPVYLIILSYLAKRLRDKHYPIGHPLRTYFMKGLYIKFFGAVFIALVYQYYYRGGDTFQFFDHARIINSALDDSFTSWFKLITNQSLEKNPELYSYVSKLEWYKDKPSYAIASLAAVLGLFNNTSYIPIALLFAFFSYTGIWAMYRTFTTLYPNLYKELALAFLFIPSTFVWGSAVFKDTVCMFGLGWITYTSFRIFIQRDLSLKNLTLLTLGFYLVYTIKIYILLAFIPAIAVWLVTTYSSRIKYSSLQFLLKLVFIGVVAGGFLLFTQVFANKLEAYSLDNIAQTAASTRGWLTYMTIWDNGAAYDLGEFDPSIWGMLKKFPQAVVVTLFRPFPWEARKVIVMFSAIEALVFIYFTYKAFQKRGIMKTIKLIIKDPNIMFCLIFSLIFAFAVGISSSNFGALSRYKIPCLPFYATFLMIIINYDKPLSKEKELQLL